VMLTKTTYDDNDDGTVLISTCALIVQKMSLLADILNYNFFI
jgi:hypothetical protein